MRKMVIIINVCRLVKIVSTREAIEYCLYNIIINIIIKYLYL